MGSIRRRLRRRVRLVDGWEPADGSEVFWGACGAASWDEFYAAMKRGFDCPTCRRWMHADAIKLHASMVAFLTFLVHAFARGDVPHEDGWIHIANVMLALEDNAARYQYSKLRMWGFLRQSGESVFSPGKSGARGDGLWKITDAGREFVHGSIRARRGALVFGRTVLAWSAVTTSVSEALRDRFDIDELRSGILRPLERT